MHDYVTLPRIYALCDRAVGVEKGSSNWAFSTVNPNRKTDEGEQRDGRCIHWRRPWWPHRGCPGHQDCRPTQRQAEGTLLSRMWRTLEQLEVRPPNVQAEDVGRLDLRLVRMRCGPAWKGTKPVMSSTLNPVISKGIYSWLFPAVEQIRHPIPTISPGC